MTCRHRDPINNPECTSYRTPAEQLEELGAQAKALRERFSVPEEPDNSRFELLEMTPVGSAMLLRVRYESCPRCSYEGVKLLVYRDVTVLDVARWRTIDPHFTEAEPASRAHAPSPIARFPDSKDGRRLALETAQRVSETADP